MSVKPVRKPFNIAVLAFVDRMADLAERPPVWVRYTSRFPPKTREQMSDEAAQGRRLYEEAFGRKEIR